MKWLIWVFMFVVCVAVVVATPYNDTAHIFLMDNNTESSIPGIRDYRTNINYSMSTAAIFTNESANLSNGNDSNRSLAKIYNTTSYIEYNSSFFTAANFNTTIEFWWLEAHGGSDGSSYRKFFGQPTTPGGAHYIRASRDPYHNGFALSLATPSGAWSINTSSYADGNATWYHVAFVINEEWMSICVNGSNRSHIDFGAALPAASKAIPGYAVWTSYVGSGYDSMYIDEFRVWNRSRTCGNVSSLMNWSIFREEAGAPVVSNASNLSISVYDEDSQVKFVQTNLTLKYYNSVERNVTFENGTVNLTDLAAGEYDLTVGQSYNETDYYPRQRLITLNATGANINLYYFLLNTTYGTRITVSVTDSILPLSNITIQSLRRHTLFGWLPVEEHLTNIDGKAEFTFHANAGIPYRLAFYKNATLLGMKEYKNIFGSTISESFPSATSIFDELARYQNFSASLTISNVTNEVIFIYVDPTHNIVESNLTIRHLTQTGRSTDCSDSEQNWLGLLNCTMPNVTGREYFIETCVLWSSASTPQCEFKSTILGGAGGMGRMGAFFVMIIMVLVFAFGAMMGGGPTAILLVAVVGILARMAGWWAIPYYLLSPLIVLWLIMIYVARRSA